VTPEDQTLRREVGLPGAVLLGLGSILGTGVFVSLGVAAGIAGAAVVPALVVAAFVATCNGLSSAQLAATYPVSGGTYTYGRRCLGPGFGFTAGWMFLCAKGASAATAALGFGGYLLNLFGGAPGLLVPIALGALVLLTIVVLRGIRRSNAVNAVLVCTTLAALATFVAVAAPRVDGANFSPLLCGPRDFLHATALLFVAYTGYGRVATLGEEVHEPRRTIPKAILATLVVSLVVYVAVGASAVGAAGADAFADATGATAAPLEVLARSFGATGAAAAIAVGAMVAMLGVLLNLLLGLSRVLLAMGRERDLPAIFGRLDIDRSPRAAILGVSLLVAVLAATGSVKTTWSLSAFTVLLYYAITNLSALRLPPERRLYPRWISWAGLLACLFLAVWVDLRTWLTGLALIAAGWAVRAAVRRRTA